MPLYFNVQSWEIWLKTCLAANTDFAIKFEGVKDAQYYKNKFSVDDVDVLIGYENNNLLETPDTFTLSKPLVVLWTRKGINDRGTVEKGLLQVEFQILANSFYELQGYQTLFQALLDPHERKGLWLGYGLALHNTQDGMFVDGQEIHKSLKGRLYIQTLVSNFTILGDMYNDT